MMDSSYYELEKKYPKGDIVSGHVHRLLNYGAEVKLDDGTEGIIRNRELLWDREPSDPAEVLKQGQPVKALIIGLDRERSRLELSLRQAERDPWHGIDQRYRVGQVLRRKVARLWRSGAFVEIEPAVDGFIPLNEVCTSPPAHIDRVLWAGDTVEAVITRLDRKERRVELSIRERLQKLKEDQLTADQQPIAIQGKSLPLIEALRPESRQRLAQWLSQHPSEEASEREQMSEHAALAQRFPKLFIVEDDHGFSFSLARLLRRLGHQVEAVESAEKAVTQFSADKCDLVLMDLGFTTGQMDGLEATKRILAINPATPIVVITGVNWLERHTNAITEARQAGARSALMKPMALHHLQEVMRLIAESKDAWTAAQVPEDLGQARLSFLSSRPGMISFWEELLPLVGRKLEELQKATGAMACVLFHMEPATREVQVFAHSGAPLNQEELTKHTLQASPVDEVISYNQQVYEPDTSRNPLRFRHLQLVDFASCIGVPVESVGQTEYGLFLFHSQRNHFTAAHLHQTMVTANMLGAIMLQKEAERIIRRMQPLIFIGHVGSTLVHELNNRLGSVLNDAETLGQDYKRIVSEPMAALDPQWRDRVGACINHVQARGRDIDEITKLYMGLVRTEKYEPVNVNDVIRRSIRFLEHFAEGSKIMIIPVLASDLPATMSTGVHLEQVFLNIMMNAIQQTHLAKGGGKLIIQTGFQDSTLPIKVRFTDTGPGIHFQNQERIFDLGFSTRPDGTGIGLFITKGLVESLWGRISVEESVMLMGTTFLVELPLVVPAAEGVRA
jgi:signal transduction histidine kinase/predicted RNA-binding protein with RPS1 domain/DNA-binding response OmpR family regulator